MASIKLFAGTDIGLRGNNEDNFIVCPDLTINSWMVPVEHQDTITLGEKGCLVVVADGMGGMNAGEVASDIAIKTVQHMFAPSVLPANIIDKPEYVKTYIKDVISHADQNIKQRCKTDPSTEGMGSTIVIAWLLRNKIYIGWLGDSRAYSYSDKNGIIRLTKDHSYVQQLVDAKMLSEEEAMHHPESNVITRSLGDTSQRAKADVIEHIVTEGEIILICSDGLCGVCSDLEIAEILRHESGNLLSCKEKLTESALDAGGSDNITVALLQIVTIEDERDTDNYRPEKKRLTYIVSGILIFLLLATYGIVKIFLNNDSTKVESLTLHVSSQSLQYGETASFNVVIVPQTAVQYYSLEYDNSVLSIDTLSHSISMKQNHPGNTQIVAVSKKNNTIRDTVHIVMKKRVSNSNPVQKSEDSSFEFRINSDGQLEFGNSYTFEINANSEILDNGSYYIECTSPYVYIDKENNVINISDSLTTNEVCIFTITLTSDNDVSKVFEYNLIGSGITVSNSKKSEVTKNNE